MNAVDVATLISLGLSTDEARGLANAQTEMDVAAVIRVVARPLTRGRLIVLFGSLWASVLLILLWQWHATPRALLFGSLSFPLYYLGVSWLISIQYWRGQRNLARL